MDKQLHHLHASDEITYPFLNFDGSTGEVWEWMSNFIPHFTEHGITYPLVNPVIERDPRRSR